MSNADYLVYEAAMRKDDVEQYYADELEQDGRGITR